ncbi:MAG: hypothetical protein NWP98_08375 [Erythrobacter sp.]|nr:hypothetical protein [Erythrobacter sp.]
MKINFISILFACMALSQPVMAQSPLEGRAKAIDDESSFTGTANYPDVLSPALRPYLQCELRRAGSKVLSKGEVVEGPSSESECTAIRETALANANKVLDREGIESEEARARIIKRAFGAIDALAASQRVWRAANQ